MLVRFGNFLYLNSHTTPLKIGSNENVSLSYTTLAQGLN
ncbi:hypothetical protein C8R28_100893 [Nitrosomonas ureae]|uniref:Uncharacterized protein n=1 Tax=Nitrosomonas ureae TaxID=44577 RepID=A0A2T5ISU1_9PROT|nr:hypothetical protein C8R28_100893 [Nitrosomonas ureae]